jgi:hypothetical protein
MTPHMYVRPLFPGRPQPRGCRQGYTGDDGQWTRCDQPEDDPIHERDERTERTP